MISYLSNLSKKQLRLAEQLRESLMVGGGSDPNKKIVEDNKQEQQ